MLAASKAAEPGALYYEYYMPEDRGTCTVLERYADNAVVMAHLGNFGEKRTERFLAAFTPEWFIVCGPANYEVRTALKVFGATHQAIVAGFHR